MCFVLMCCVFFFKQKTAYEMRISDWSSDVCSSDLPLVGADGEPYAMAQGSLAVGGLGVEGGDGSQVVVNVPSSGRIPDGATVERMEIGRASCRERVCQ